MDFEANVKRLLQKQASRPGFAVALQVLPVFFIQIMALLGNITVCVTIIKTPRLHITLNYYIVGLAVTEFLSAAIIGPWVIINAASNGFNFSHFTCEVLGIVTSLLACGSLFGTSLIAVSRYFYIVKPVTYRKVFIPKNALAMIIASWTFTAALFTVLGVLEFGHFEYYPGRFLCLLTYNNLERVQLFSLSFLTLFTLLPITTILLSYWRIYRVIKHHVLAVAPTLHHERTKARKELQMTKSVLAIVFVFIVSWIPCTVLYVLTVHYPISYYAEEIFTIFALIGMALNPFVYGKMNPEFRNAAKKIILSPRRARIRRVGSTSGKATQNSEKVFVIHQISSINANSSQNNGDNNES